MSEYDESDDDEFPADNVDWARELDIESRATSQSSTKHTGLGDPTRFGASQQVTISAYDTDVYMGQILRVDAADAYPRNWQMVGALVINQEMFDSPAADYGWLAYLDIAMGVGQAMVQHRVNLRALLDLAITPGLYSANSSWYAPVAQGSQAVVPWILPGGLVGKALNVRMGFRAPAGDLQITLPVTIGATALISPYAAGHGL